MPSFTCEQSLFFLFFDGVLAGLVIRVGDHGPAAFNNALLVHSWSQCCVSAVKCVAEWQRGRSRSSRFTHGTALRKEFRGTDEQ